MNQSLFIKDAAYYIKNLDLKRHIEGGAFRETYRSKLILSKDQLGSIFTKDCASSTMIYFLLQYGEFSAFHKIASDEVWHFYDGSGLSIYEIEKEGRLIEHKLGRNLELGEEFQCVVKAGNWFGSRVNDPGGFALVGCTVAPGFNFEDLVLGNRQDLCSEYPQWSELITQMTYR